MRIRDEGCRSNRPPPRPHLGPQAPTRGLEAFLGIYLEIFEREELDLSLVRQMTEEQLQRIGIERMGQRLNILQAAAELTEEEVVANYVTIVANL